MMQFAVYDMTTGAIKRRILCPNDCVDIQLGVDEEYYLNCPPDATHIINNVPETIAPAPPPLDEVKSAQKQAISQAFTDSLTSSATSYTTTGLATNITINARKTDLDNAMGLAQSLRDNSEASTQFRCFDNSFVTVTPADLDQIAKELRMVGRQAYEKKWTLQSQIDAATTADAVTAVVW